MAVKRMKAGSSHRVISILTHDCTKWEKRSTETAISKMAAVLEIKSRIFPAPKRCSIFPERKVIGTETIREAMSEMQPKLPVICRMEHISRESEK